MLLNHEVSTNEKGRRFTAYVININPARIVALNKIREMLIDAVQSVTEPAGLTMHT